ncbi:b4b665d0-393a-46b6-a026-abf72712679b [Sclerotinia trifoliorum]|uniref:B4b665d0-393a-46b6-a026-abf72712679b n=1 Tax=Sclerotinia trifoliorum TaxID=28548 RepID=A0A8H2VS54_9HELO|nr:b4b665d0-393a-46b6-a026-abf72712679b [Sclerotinia trifoliorum]
MPSSLEPPNDTTRAVLLAWINTFPATLSKIKAIEDLTDGLVFSDMLEDFDPAYAIKDIPQTTSSTKWVIAKQTLEAVYKSLLRYVHEHCNNWVKAAVVEYPIDFNALAQYSDPVESTKLITIFMLVALKGPNQMRYIDRVRTKLGVSAQSVIAVHVETIEKDLAVALPTLELNRLTKPYDALDLEEKFSVVVNDHAALKKRNADLITRLENLSESRDHLLDENKEQDILIKQLQEMINHGGQNEHILRLEKRLEDSEQLIATQEQQLEDARVNRELKNKELVSVKNSRDLEVQDRFKELEVENSALLKRANKVEHYEKKLAQQNAIEKENARLREQLDVLQENQKDYDKVHLENELLKTTRGEYMKVLETQEHTITDLRSKGMRLEEELRLRLEEIEVHLERQRHDERYISELQERIDSQSPEEPSGGFSLEDELNRSDSPNGPNPQLEISRLRAELQVLKSNEGGKANAELRSELQKSEMEVRRLREKTQELKEAHAVTQDQLATIMGDRSLLSTDEAERAKSAGQSLYSDATQEIKRLNQAINELSAKLTSSERDLLRARADLSAMDSDEITALEQLKEANELVASSYEKDLALLQAQHNDLRAEFIDQQSHLLAALKSKDKLSEQVKTIFQKPSSSNEETGENPEPVTALDALKEQLQKKESTIQELQRRLVLAEDPEAQKAANDVLVKNLTRENTLIATAWYDLTSRLQSNHVVLQRRQDAPKSWLNKQRQLVNSGPRR